MFSSDQKWTVGVSLMKSIKLQFYFTGYLTCTMLVVELWFKKVFNYTLSPL